MNPHPSLVSGLQIVRAGGDMEGKTEKKKKERIKRKYRMNTNYFMGLNDKKVNTESSCEEK